MKNIFKKIAYLNLIFLFFSIPTSYSKTTKSLTIFAEPNLASALTEISRLYSKESAVVVSIELGSASDMINRIEEGEDSDLFISAHKTWIDDLKQKGLVDIYNINHITDDTLVLVTSTNNKKIPKTLKVKGLKFNEALSILNKNRFDLVVDHSSSSLGQHSDHLVDDKKFRSIRLYKKLPEDRSSAADLIRKNPNIYSVMLGSQINGNDNFQAISTLKNREIFYEALVVAGDSMENAREFSNFLKNDRSQKIFRKNGFVGEY